MIQRNQISGSKYCPLCKEDKPIYEFRTYRRNPDGLANQCKFCTKTCSTWEKIQANEQRRQGHIKQKRTWQSRRKEELSVYNRQFAVVRYGITMDEYNKMLEIQGGVCAICHQLETFIQRGRLQALSVDHDHETGKVRGLLCHRCNTHLFAYVRPEILRSAADYLEKHK